MSYFAETEVTHYPFAQISWSSIPTSGAVDPDVVTNDSPDSRSWLSPTDGGYLASGNCWIDATIKLQNTNYYGYFQVGTSTISRAFGGSAYGTVNYTNAPNILAGSDDVAVSYGSSCTYHMITMSASGWSIRDDSRMHVMRVEL